MSKVLSGGRAIVKVNNVAVGIFESATYNMNYGTEPIHILGKFGPTEICITSAEACTINCSGFRVLDNGPYSLPKVPKLKDLLNLENVTITIVDRQSKKAILTAINCVANSFNGNHNSRATSRISISYVGTALTDENSEGDAEVGATDLP